MSRKIKSFLIYDEKDFSWKPEKGAVRERSNSQQWTGILVDVKYFFGCREIYYCRAPKRSSTGLNHWPSIIRRQMNLFPIFMCDDNHKSELEEGESGGKRHIIKASEKFSFLPQVISRFDPSASPTPAWSRLLCSSFSLFDPFSLDVCAQQQQQPAWQFKSHWATFGSPAKRQFVRANYYKSDVGGWNVE